MFIFKTSCAFFTVCLVRLYNHIGNIKQANYPRLLGIFVSRISNKENAHWFWSSSPIANNPNNAWIVNFNNGNDNNNNRDNNNRVRLVRSLGE